MRFRRLKQVFLAFMLVALIAVPSLSVASAAEPVPALVNGDLTYFAGHGTALKTDPFFDPLENGVGTASLGGFSSLFGRERPVSFDFLFTEGVFALSHYDRWYAASIESVFVSGVMSAQVTTTQTSEAVATLIAEVPMTLNGQGGYIGVLTAVDYGERDPRWKSLFGPDWYSLVLYDEDDVIDVVNISQLNGEVEPVYKVSGWVRGEIHFSAPDEQQPPAE